MLWGIALGICSELLWGGKVAQCSGKLTCSGEVSVALGNCSWEAILLWGIALGRQYCSGELLL
ncbi:MAG TPA: hypothetical protein PLB63_07405, partial [Planctomycetota bacterium]|nr:hypothetical protein [Planctomycetota bacterium]HQB00503.1 hypothetical protein [Planctomycetota bacterium]